MKINLDIYDRITTFFTGIENEIREFLSSIVRELVTFEEDGSDDLPF